MIDLCMMFLRRFVGGGGGGGSGLQWVLLERLGRLKAKTLRFWFRASFCVRQKGIILAAWIVEERTKREGGWGRNTTSSVSYNRVCSALFLHKTNRSGLEKGHSFKRLKN